MDNWPPSALNASPEGANNRLGRAGLRLATLDLLLVAGMLAALQWMPWMQPPLIHIMILFVGFPLGAILGLVAAALSAGGLGSQPRLGAMWGLALSLLALA